MNAEQLLKIKWQVGMEVLVVNNKSEGISNRLSEGDVGVITDISLGELNFIKKRILIKEDPFNSNYPIKVKFINKEYWMGLNEIFPLSNNKQATVSIPDIV